MTDQNDLRERVARAIANVREGGWPAYALLQQHYLTMADAALAEMGTVQRCAECDCDNPPDGCNWIAAEPAQSVREAAFTEAADRVEKIVWTEGTGSARDRDVFTRAIEMAAERLRTIAEGKDDA